MSQNSMHAHTNTHSKKPRMSTREMVFLGLLSAIGILLSSIEIPLFAAAPHLKYDPGDVVILIGAMYFGPFAGLGMSFVISFVQSFMVHGSGGVYGFLMHIIASGVMSMVAGAVYHRKERSVKTAVLALGAASLAMVIAMVGANLVITPLYLKEMPREAIYKTIIPVVIPFNLLKAGINSVATFLLHRGLAKTKVFDRLG